MYCNISDTHKIFRADTCWAFWRILCISKEKSDFRENSKTVKQTRHIFHINSFQLQKMFSLSLLLLISFSVLFFTYVSFYLIFYSSSMTAFLRFRSSHSTTLRRIHNTCRMNWYPESLELNELCRLFVTPLKDFRINIF